jgi:hypothetical protein
VEEAADAPCERTLLVSHYVAAGYEEYGKVRPHVLHEAMKLKSVNRGHTDVSDQAIDIAQPGVDHCLGRRVSANQITARLEKFSERLQNSRVVIDKSYRAFAVVHGRLSGLRRERVIGI